MQLSLRIQSMARPEGDRDAVFDHLVGVVEEAVGGKGAPPVLLAVRGDRVELVAIGALAKAEVNAARFAAALTASRVDGGPPPDAVGLMGTFRMRRGPGSPVPIVQVFLEWPDNAWQHWLALLDPESKSILDDSVTRRLATLGDAMPNGLGRWWAQARRHDLRLSFSRRAQSEPATSPMVH